MKSPPHPRLADHDVSRAGLAVVTWNVHEGRGDIARVVDAFAPAHVVVLVQEAIRKGDDVPSAIPRSVKAPRGGNESAEQVVDIVQAADALGFWVAYVPSMRNGRDVREDRGCAILSTLPLKDPAAIELPWVHQRRVAVMATVAGSDTGRPRSLRVVSTHLDNRSGRKEQAEALAEWLKPFVASGEPLVVGGDFNSWFGADEETVREVARVVPLVESCRGKATFRLGLRLDHLFATPSAAPSDCEVAADTYGSDHHPIIGLIR